MYLRYDLVFCFYGMRIIMNLFPGGLLYELLKSIRLRLASGKSRASSSGNTEEGKCYSS